MVIMISRWFETTAIDLQKSMNSSSSAGSTKGAGSSGRGSIRRPAATKKLFKSCSSSEEDSSNEDVNHSEEFSDNESDTSTNWSSDERLDTECVETSENEVYNVGDFVIVTYYGVQDAGKILAKLRGENLDVMEMARFSRHFRI